MSELDTVQFDEDSSLSEKDDRNDMKQLNLLANLKINNVQYSSADILLEALINQICRYAETDASKQKHLFMVICDKLHDLKLLGRSYKLNELQYLREKYMNILQKLILAAKCVVDIDVANDQCGDAAIPLDTRIQSLRAKLFDWSRYAHEFRELDFIARGGFGQVYKAHNILDDCNYAVKKISLKYQKIDSFVQSLREVQTLAKLNHPNIVAYKAAWLEPFDSRKHSVLRTGAAPRIQEIKPTLPLPRSVGIQNRPQTRLHVIEESKLSNSFEIEFQDSSHSDSVVQFQNSHCSSHTIEKSEKLKVDTEAKNIMNKSRLFESNDSCLSKHNIETSKLVTEARYNIKKSKLLDSSDSSLSNHSFETSIVETENRFDLKKSKLLESSDSSMSNHYNETSKAKTEAKYKIKKSKLLESSDSSLSNHNIETSKAETEDRYIKKSKLLESSDSSTGLHNGLETNSQGHISSQVNHSKESTEDHSSGHHGLSETGWHDSLEDVRDKALVPVQQGRGRYNAVQDMRRMNYFFPESQTVSMDWVTLYIQMQLCQLTLKEWLSCAACDDVNVYDSQVLYIFKQIVQGLDYIHSQGIVHHDIKPSNIFVSHDLSSVQVGDFGLACSLLPHTPHEGGYSVISARPRSDHPLGTRLYAAPEQLHGLCDPKSDVYSLGIVLFEMLINSSTDMEKSKEVTRLKMGHMSPSIASQYPHYAKIITKLLDVNPKHRPSASQILMYLKSFFNLRDRIIPEEQHIDCEINGKVEVPCGSDKIKSKVDFPRIKGNEKDVTMHELKLELSRKQNEIAELQHRIRQLESGES